MGNIRRDAVFMVLVAFCSVQVLAAATGGRVKGTVVDQNGLPVVGVTITYTSEATDFHDTSTTDKKGKFAYYFVDASGPYNLRFEKEGHRTTDVPLRPQIGGNLRLQVELPTEDSESAGGRLGGEPVLSAGAEAFNLGVNAARDGDRETAKERFFEAIKEEPELVAPYPALASIYQDEGDNPRAIEFAQKALAKEPDNARALMTLYDVYNDLGDTERANSYMDRVLANGGGMDAAIRIYNAGAESFRGGDLDTAALRFKEAVQLAPDFADAYAALGSTCLAQGETQNALDAANSALGIESGNRGALRTKYNAQIALGDDAGAAETLAVMAKSDSAGTAEALFSRGRQAFEAGDVEMATQALSRAVEVDPLHAGAHYTLGLCFINSGDQEKAKNHLEIFLALEPEHPEAANAREMLKYAG